MGHQLELDGANLLVRVVKLGVLLAPELAPDCQQILAWWDLLLLLGDMLHHGLSAILGLVLADEARIPDERQRHDATRIITNAPQLRGDTKVLTAAHQGVTLASLCGSRDTRRVKVLLLATGNGNEAGWCQPLHYTLFKPTVPNKPVPTRATQCGGQRASHREEPYPILRDQRQR